MEPNQENKNASVFHAPNYQYNGQPNQPGQGAGPAPQGKPTETELQRELEAQIRAFGSTVTDGLRYGFEGRGGELGSRARGMGSAFVDVLSYGLEQGRQAMNTAQAQSRAYTPNTPHAGVWRGASVTKNQLKSKANVRLALGLTELILGGTVAFGLLLAGIICTGVGLGIGGMPPVLIVGICLTVGGLPFLWPTFTGIRSLSAAGRLRSYAAAASLQESVPVAMLANAVQRTEADTRADLCKLIRCGWITAWLDESQQTLYLNEQAYRLACQQAAQQAEAEKNAQDPQTAQATATLASMENFITVILQEKQMMQDDPQAVEELDQMAQTSRAILDWVKAHPETLPQSRRLASYYIPTTLKLLHTYNEVKAQDGDNAESIRRDIAGMLHTLNTAFTNLHDTLLSDVALDVSSEIAALQGMLARDGLSEDDILKMD